MWEGEDKMLATHRKGTKLLPRIQRICDIIVEICLKPSNAGVF
jgi:hypothetical protein